MRNLHISLIIAVVASLCLVYAAKVSAVAGYNDLSALILLALSIFLGLNFYYLLEAPARTTKISRLRRMWSLWIVKKRRYCSSR